MHRTDKARTGGRQADEHLMEDSEAVNLAADWSDISQGLRKDLGHQLHSQWIKPIQLGALNRETGALDLYLPTEFSANWVSDRFADRLSLAWKIARPDVRHVRVSVHPGRRQMPELRLGNSRNAANDSNGSMRDGTMLVCGGEELGSLGQASIGLDPSLTFASFAYPGFHLLMPLYGCESWTGVLHPREGQALAWVEPARLRDYPAPPADLPLFDWLLEQAKPEL